MLRVTAVNAESANEIFTQLMGEVVEPRREFIQDNALNVANLERAAILAPLAVAGVMVGVWLVRRISVKRFYQLTYWLVFLLSLKLIYDGAVGVFMPGAAA